MGQSGKSWLKSAAPFAWRVCRAVVGPVAGAGQLFPGAALMGQSGSGEASCQDKGILWCCTPNEGPEGGGDVAAGSSYPYQTPNTGNGDPSLGGAGAPTAPTTRITFEQILSDLEAAEQAGYGEAFTSCAGGKSTAQMDCVPLREFILAHSAIGPDELDPELLRVANDEGAFNMDGFLHVIRENAVSDTACIEQFLGVSSNGETVAAEECRSSLLIFSQQHLQASFSEEQWDRVFNTVMWDSGVQVSMEKYIGYCKIVARVVRLAQYARV
mmetsp:Transcript_134963/g.233484  ORF Transcript_134963/g.233484 Transcript_134963/m.233484 type:complete len:270 (+) Transcript_134963:1-810(+)